MNAATRRKAAKKAAQTRRANKASIEYYNQVSLPGMRRMNTLLTILFRACPEDVWLRWNPTRDTGYRLKHGVIYGRLVGFRDGLLLRVLPEGYKQPKEWHPSFWEPLALGTIRQVRKGGAR